MAESHLLPRPATTPRHYSRPQVPVVEVAFHGGNSIPWSPPSRPENGYVDPSTRRSSSNESATASWQAGHLTPRAAGYEGVEVMDESTILETMYPALFQAAIEEHARRLGLDPIVDAEFRWIVRESLVAPLPEGWYHITASESGHPYYYNELSGESRWDHPSDEQFRQLIHEQKRLRQHKVHRYREPQPVGYDEGWQAAQRQQIWETRRQMDAYSQDYGTQYPTWQEQVDSPRKEQGNPSFTGVSSGRDEVVDDLPLRRKLEEMETQKVTDQNKLMRLNQLLERRDEALQEAKREVKQLTQTLDNLSLQEEERKKERDEAVAVAEILARELRAGTEETAKVHDELLETQETLRKELKDVEKLQTQLLNEQSARIQLEQQLEQVTKQQVDMDTKMAAAEATIRRLQDELSRKREREEKNEDEGTASAMIKELQEQLGDKEIELEVERARAIVLEQDIVELQASQATTEETLNSYVLKADRYEKELEAMKLRLTSSMMANTALTKQLEEDQMSSMTQIQELDGERRKWKREFRGIERELNTQRKESQEWKEQVAALTLTLASAETKLESLTQTIEKERMEAVAEAQQASAESLRLAMEEKAHISALYTQEMLLRRQLHNRIMELQGNIRVFCRVRPVQPVEVQSGQSALAVFFREHEPGSLELYVTNEGSGDKASTLLGQKHAFEFDHVFQPTSSQDQVFDQTRALIMSALDGFNVCIFAYGQTGSGKTHTMEGPAHDRGVNFRALRELFAIRDARLLAENVDCSLKLSILEVYNETIVDLLAPDCGRSPGAGSPSTIKGLDVRVGKTGVYVENLRQVEVNNEKDVLDLMQLGHSHRSVGSHDFNEHSSRSHLVLSIVIETTLKPDTRRRVSRLHLIDLAGSERVSKTAASGQRLREAQNINRSLSALGDVIAALGSHSKHVPYRNSKLTFLLQDSLSGNSKVLMFVNVSPVQWNAGETLCSLNFAARCRSVALGQAKPAAATNTPGASPSNGITHTVGMNAMLPSNSGGGRLLAPIANAGLNR